MILAGNNGTAVSTAALATQQSTLLDSGNLGVGAVAFVGLVGAGWMMLNDKKKRTKKSETEEIDEVFALENFSELFFGALKKKPDDDDSFLRPVNNHFALCNQ